MIMMMEEIGQSLAGPDWDWGEGGFLKMYFSKCMLVNHWPDWDCGEEGLGRGERRIGHREVTLTLSVLPSLITSLIKNMIQLKSHQKYVSKITVNC